MANAHVLQAKNGLLHGTFSRDYEPILTIQSGDSISLNTIGLEWGYTFKDGNKIKFQSREKEEGRGHPLIGPIAIEGAKPGMTLEVKINDLVPSWYGWNVTGGSHRWHNVRLGLTEVTPLKVDWEIDTESMKGQAKIGDQTFSVPLSPFMGIMATAPSEEGVHSTIPPRYCGGNIDCKELVKGSSIYLPVAVEGGLFSVGDGHAAQGDGEVSGTAIECPMDKVDLTFILHEGITLNMPQANTPAGWIAFGFDDDLNKATIAALDGILDIIQQKYGLEKAEAVSLASVAVDLRITQIVNGVKGVHAVLPHGSIEVIK
ncbi:acetamidase/formamidase family protein [Jeotgalibacillus proteolyticus]|uniref:Acetamidase n=1 Tax=Jeotgalibacillus proteolyticus TaxID=2082395 RepID=A0A2S5GCU7_9BACL|nr:acetamidase/formamidase family protein [Jeotgalibacillus proteolyticus]PPA70734.1 acetamidase [Jeotgalibacillus proteolyticus]